VRDLRDRALIATLTYSFARIGAALKMKVEDLRPKGAGWELRLHEKGGKHHVMPCHHALAEALCAYTEAAGIEDDRKGFLFRTSKGHRGVELALEGGGGWHLRAGGQSFVSGNRDHGLSFQWRRARTREKMAAHESPRTTKLYDRTKERLTQDEVVAEWGIEMERNQGSRLPGDTHGVDREPVPVRLQVRLFGAIEIIVDGRRLRAFNSLRLQRFLALIALRRGPQHRSRLAFELWPDSDETQARTNIRKLLHDFRPPSRYRCVRRDRQRNRALESDRADRGRRVEIPRCPGGR